MPVALAALYGAVIGSFLNVVAYRLPRSESLDLARIALPQLRHANQALRQHPGARLAAAARSLPQVPGGESRPVTRWSKRSRPALAVAVMLVEALRA